MNKTLTDIMSPKEVAEFYGLSMATLSTWRTTGKGPKFFRMGARLVKYERSDIEAWIREQNPDV